MVLVIYAKGQNPMPAKLKILPPSLNDNGEVTRTSPPSVDEIKSELQEVLAAAIASATNGEYATFMALEGALLPTVRRLGQLLLLLFLAVREARERARTPERVEKAGRVYRRRPPQARNLDTIFGVLRYFRTYMLGPDGHGYHPVDVDLGLTADRLSMNLLSVAARLATFMGFARVHATMSWLLGAAPSTEVIENTVLGLGRRTGEWFERTAPPSDEGEVLILQFDSKGAPTATDTELERRRGPRRPNSTPASPRHRGRDRRERYGSKPRRKKGDKSKNAKMATLVVMYTLRRSTDGSGRLYGPMNRRFYASFAPKRHTFAVARREADKRGFTRGSGKFVQIVSDGDEDLAKYIAEFFPEATHTVDVMHVLEYIHTAGECLYREGSTELTAWMEQQKERLYGGQEPQVVAELRTRLAAIPATGPGNKGKRERLAKSISYLSKRLGKMNYKSLAERDLELGSGAVEGAVKNIIAARFDFGGSRWIRERAEALLQLRCIEANGDWGAFTQWVHDDHREHSLNTGARIRVQQIAPSSLPIFGVVA